jgi:Flp pilus assembly protein TadG
MNFNWFKRYFWRQKERGQSIVEISLITPLLLIALYIPVDFGISFYVGNAVGNAAREGARIGSGLAKSGNVYTSTQADQIRDYVRDTVKVPQWLTSRQLLIKFYDGANCSQYIDVTVQGNYNFFLYQIINLFGFNVQDSVVISRRTQMRYNFQPTGAPADSLCTTPTTFPAYSI